MGEFASPCLVLIVVVTGCSLPRQAEFQLPVRVRLLSAQRPPWRDPHVVPATVVESHISAWIARPRTTRIDDLANEDRFRLASEPSWRISIASQTSTDLASAPRGNVAALAVELAIEVTVVPPRRGHDGCRLVSLRRILARRGTIKYERSADPEEGPRRQVEMGGRG